MPKMIASAPRRWLETVMRGTPCDRRSSSVKLEWLVSHRFKTPILTGSPNATLFITKNREFEENLKRLARFGQAATASSGSEGTVVPATCPPVDKPVTPSRSKNESLV
jgi:hypothetical protein